MEDAIKALGNFIFRDFFYAVAGGLILIAIAIFANHAEMSRFKSLSEQTVLVPALVAGVAYTIGYLNQELWSQPPFVTTSQMCSYNPFLKGCYHRHVSQPWTVEKIEIQQKTFDKSLSEERYVRVLNNKAVSASMGSSFLTVSIILAAAQFIKIDVELGILALASFLIGAALIILCWVKSMQQYRYLYIRQTALANGSPEFT